MLCEIPKFQVFASQSYKDDLFAMLMAVDKKIQEKNQLQTTETVNRGLNNKLYFNRGMRKCDHGCKYAGSDDDVGLHEKSFQSDVF